MISVVCCFNDMAKYNTILIPSLQKQRGVEYEIVSINNAEGSYHSAAEALNVAMERTQYKYTVFVHQDFAFVDEYALKNICEELSALDYRSVIGVAGAIRDVKAGWIKKIIGRDRKIISFLVPSDTSLETCKYEVDSIDECCFAFDKKLWEEHHFNSEICFAWDLYAVEVCLYVQKKGAHCFVAPIRGTHLSYGIMDERFFRALYLLSLAYCSSVKYIVTTCVVFKCGGNKKLKILWLSIVNQIRMLKRFVMGSW